MTDSDVPVRVDDLHKTYPGPIEAVRGVSFDVGAGEIFGLLGPNGAGKTTTLGVLTTLVRPTGGRAMVAGHDVRRSPLAVRRVLGVVFQDSVLDNDFTARQNLWLHARLWRLPHAEAARRIDGLLETMGLADRADDSVRTYSGGMRRRLEIARALLARPQVVVLDEPTVGLDPAVRDEIWALIGRLRRDEGVTIVLSTHYLEEAADVCDRVAIMDGGQIVAGGSPASIVDDLGAQIVELRVNGSASAAVAALSALEVATRAPLVRRDIVSVPTAAAPEELAQRVAELRHDGLGVASTTVRRTTLADVFAQVTTNGGRR